MVVVVLVVVVGWEVVVGGWVVVVEDFEVVVGGAAPPDVVLADGGGVGVYLPRDGVAWQVVTLSPEVKAARPSGCRTSRGWAGRLPTVVEFSGRYSLLSTQGTAYRRG